MSREKNKDNRKNNNEDASIKPDPQTLNKTDPQENMEGPVSSLMHNAGEGFDTEESREEADDKKDKRI